MTLNQSHAGARNENSAVILTYHNIEQETEYNNAISQELFQAHIATLIEGPSSVIPLEKFISKGEQDAGPERPVVITLENVTRQSLSFFHSELIKRNLPYTAFISPEHFNSVEEQDDLKKMASHPLVSIGLHPHEYQYYDSAAEFRQALNRAIGFYRDLFQLDPVYFAFPFGLYRQDHLDILGNYHFSAVFGQQAGAAKAGQEILPRFSMMGDYAHEERFSEVLKALPFAIEQETSQPTIVTDNPIVSVTLRSDHADSLEKLSCFLTNHGKLEPQILGQRHLELRPLLNEPGRYRLNCTLPVGGEVAESIYWLGYLFEYRTEKVIQRPAHPEFPE